MFKNAYFKWYLIVTGILISATTLGLLLRRDNFENVAWWEYPQYGFQIAITIFVCWVTHAYFLQHSLKWLKTQLKHIVSISLASIFSLILGYILTLIFPISHLQDNSAPYNTLNGILLHFIGSLLASLVCFIIFYSVYTNAALQNSRLENEILEQAHLRAQLISLQTQISPHFLFNSLSTLKTLTSEKPTKDYIMQLSAVYRYVLNFNEHYLTPLKEELKFIESYLYILTTRFENSLQVSINIDGQYLNWMLPPLSVQLLLENAIKHNRISPEQPLTISLSTNDSPALVVSNILQLKKTPEEGTGTGLTNISERYKLLVNKTIEIHKDKGYFTVILPLIKQ